jgi:hypothetical protein
MARMSYVDKIFPNVNIDSIRILNSLIPFRMGESITARSDKLAIAVLQKFLGSDWIRDHIQRSVGGFIRSDNSNDELREIQRMRRIMLAEMLFNMQNIPRLSIVMFGRHLSWANRVYVCGARDRSPSLHASIR